MNILKLIPAVSSILNLIRNTTPKKGKIIGGSAIASVLAIEEILPVPSNDIEIILKYSIQAIGALTALFGTLTHFLHEVKSGIDKPISQEASND